MQSLKQRWLTLRQFPQQIRVEIIIVIFECIALNYHNRSAEDHYELVAGLICTVNSV